MRKIDKGRTLYDVSGGLDQYRHGFIVSEIAARDDDACDDTVPFTNDQILSAGQATGDVTERDIRRIQIRETIAAHFKREQRLYPRVVKGSHCSSSTKSRNTATISTL